MAGGSPIGVNSIVHFTQYQVQSSIFIYDALGPPLMYIARLHP